MDLIDIIRSSWRYFIISFAQFFLYLNPFIDISRIFRSTDKFIPQKYVASLLYSICPTLHLGAAGKTTEKVFFLFLFSFLFKACLELYSFFLTCFTVDFCLCWGIFLFYKLYFCGPRCEYTQDHF